jgi:hypothetical protein
MRFLSLSFRHSAAPLTALASLVAVAALAGCDDGMGFHRFTDDRPDADWVAPPGDDASDGGRLGPAHPDASGAPDAGAPETSIPDSPPDAGHPEVGPPDADGDGTPDATDCAPRDPSAWQLLAYAYRDADGDGYTVAAQGTICSGASLPPGYAAFPTGNDCNDADPSIWAPSEFYPDTDGDGFGAGSPVSLCANAPPAGYAATDGDCAPTDPSAWQLFSYAYHDADGDTYTVAKSGQVCAGAVLPAGYPQTANGDDCDDTNPKVFASVTYYPDSDGDGVGAGAGVTACTDGSHPAGTSLSSTDCAPTDKTRWQTLAYSAIDHDGDGATVPANGSVCAGASLPLPYYASAQGNDCDDTNASLTHWDVLWPDKDKDGAGAGAYAFKCDGTTIPAGFSRYGDDENDADPKIGPLAPEDILDIVLR